MHKYFQKILIAIVALFSLVPFSISVAHAARGDRTLYVYYTHTKETARITFKRNGRYIKKGLAELNHMTRDWRHNEPTKMDPALFDLVWEVYQESGATGPIHIVSAYRSPKTNEMLRSRSRGVAKNSRHTKGQAMDFYIPGVRISKLRQIAMKKQVGGVGYYPTSNSPFVHLDTGSVRAWPRMTKAQLKKLFPNGRTLHVPNTGVPISKKGYQLAMVDWKKCGTVPCPSRSTPRTNTRVANTRKPTNNNSASNNNTSPDNGSPKTLFDLFFGDEGAEEGNVNVARNSPTQTRVSSVRVPARVKTAPTPHKRLSGLTRQIAQISNADAPIPSIRSKLQNDDQVEQQEENILVAAIEDNIAPTPRILLSANDGAIANSQLSSYAPMPITNRNTNVQQAIGELIKDNKIKTTPDIINTASLLKTQPELTISNDIVNASLSAIINAQKTNELTNIKPEMLNINTREITLVAPDLEHVTEIFTDPRAMSSSRYAITYEPDEADFNPATELGRFGARLSFGNNVNAGLKTSHFISSLPYISAQ